MRPASNTPDEDWGRLMSSGSADVIRHTLPMRVPHPTTTKEITSGEMTAGTYIDSSLTQIALVRSDSFATI